MPFFPIPCVDVISQFQALWFSFEKRKGRLKGELARTSGDREQKGTNQETPDRIQYETKKRKLRRKPQLCAREKG
jgi:hypothetical protein